VGVKHITAYKNYLKFFRDDGTFELMGFKCVNVLPDVARREYLRYLYNDTNYTTYTSTKFLDKSITQNILYFLSNATSRIMSSK
jgi:hypothetical protein